MEKILPVEIRTSEVKEEVGRAVKARVKEYLKNPYQYGTGAHFISVDEERIEEWALQQVLNDNSDLRSKFLIVKQRLAEAELLVEYPDDCVHTFRDQIKGVYKYLNKQNFIKGSLSACFSVLTDLMPVESARFGICLSEVASTVGLDSSLFEATITKKMWYRGISAILVNVSAYDNASFLDELYDGTLDYVAFYMGLLIHLIVLIGYEDSTKQIHRAETRIADLEEKLQKVEAKEESSVGVSIYTERIKSLEETNRDLEVKLRKKSREELVPLEQQIRKQRSRIEELEAEVQILKEVRTAEEAGFELAEEKLLDLPTEGVTFVGGHVNLHNKIKQLFPNWNVLLADSIKKYTGKSEFVFFYSDQCTHKSFERLRCVHTGSILYCSGTNIDKLVDSMRRSYTLYKNKENGVE